MTRTIAMAAVLALAGGCGDDGGETEELNGFLPPDEVTVANTGGDGSWTEVGPANWSCLGTASEDQPAATDITLSGAVEDFQSGDRVPDAMVTLYTGSDLAGSGAETVTSDVDGNFSLTIPTGSTRVAFKVEHEDALDTYAINQIYEPDTAEQTDTVNSVSLLTANALPAFIGVTRTPGLGILAGSIVDCDGNEVSNAIATVSSVSGSAEQLEGSESYYFSALSTSLPVRHQQQLNTNSDGLFVIIEVPTSAEAYVQVWGFIDGQDPATDDLTLLAEVPAPALADTVITASLEPLRQ